MSDGLISALPARAPGLVVIGGGPAGLMAAETARAAGIEVDLFEAKGSVGRKFLIAGKGGMNLTHSEPLPQFIARYRERAPQVGTWLQDFGPEDLRAWARGLGVETFVGSSGRVFPSDLKAAPLLRGWVRRLREAGVRFHVGHRWTGWNDEGALTFDHAGGHHALHSEASVLALGGASWPQLGSDGSWQPLLAARGVDIEPLKPANCGFDIGWTDIMARRHAGAPLKPIVAHWQDLHGQPQSQQGECVITATGIEGSLVYAMAADLRDTLARGGQAELQLDLAPGMSLEQLRQVLSRPRKGRSLSEFLRRQIHLQGAKAALLYEVLSKDALQDTAQLAQAIHRLPLTLQRPRPVAETISSAGGVRVDAVDDALMLRALPGVFCAGEMLDWEAPTGGYLFTASFASGRRVGEAATRWLQADQAQRR